MIRPHFPRTLVLATVLLLPAAAFAASTPAMTNIYVASYGNDANDGGLGTPKRHLQAAHDAVVSHGQVLVLDTAGYGTLRVTKSLTVTVPPSVTAFVYAPGTNAVTIKANGDDDVTLRGLTLVGGYHTGGASDAGDGILANSVGTLRVENCVIRNFYRGIEFNPAAAATLLVSDTRVQNVGSGIDLFVNASGVVADAVLSNCTVDTASDHGAYAYRDATATNATARLAASHCVFTHSGYGLYTSGGGVVFADACTFSNDDTGVVAASGSHAVSAGNNAFIDNSSDGVFNSTNGTR